MNRSTRAASTVLLAVGLYFLLDLWVREHVSLRLELAVRAEAHAVLQVRWEAAGSLGSSALRVEDTVARVLTVGLPPDVQSLRIETREGSALAIESIVLRRLFPLGRWEEADDFAGWQRDEPSGRDEGLAATGHAAAAGRQAALSSRVIGSLVQRGRRMERVAAALAGLLIAGLVLRGARRQIGPGEREEAPGAPSTPRLRRPAIALVTTTALLALTWTFWKRLQGSSPSAYVDSEGAYQPCLYNRDGQRLSASDGPLALVLDPFTVYANYPGWRTERFRFDEHGFRGGMRESGRPKAFLLGGSTAFGWGLESDAELATALLEDLQQEYTFVNAAVIGYVSGQELARMIHHVDRFRPAQYVVLDGWNEIAEQLGKQNDLGVNRNFHRFSARLHEHAVLTEDEKAVTRAGPAAVNAAEGTDFERVARTYCDNLEKMSAWAEARGAGFLVLFQPLRTGGPSGEEQAAEAVRHHRRLVEHAAEFCARNGIRSCDLSRRPEFAGAEEELFLDLAHLNPAGQRALARIIADLLANPSAK